MPKAHPLFSRPGRLSATLVRAKNRFLLLHALSKLPRPLPAGWTPLHTACYVHDFKTLPTILEGTKDAEVNAVLKVRRSLAHALVHAVRAY